MKSNLKFDNKNFVAEVSLSSMIEEDEMEIDENFTKNAYDLNSKIFKNAHCKKK